MLSLSYNFQLINGVMNFGREINAYRFILSEDLLDLLVIELVEMGHCSHCSRWRCEGAHG
jgi:hypothetical protein